MAANPSFRKGTILEQLGRESEAVDCYIAGLGKEAKRATPFNPDYSALVRLMDSPGWPGYRYRVVSAITETFSAKRPHQALKAYHNIKGNQIAPSVYAAAVVAAGRVGSIETIESIYTQMCSHVDVSDSSYDFLKALETIGYAFRKRGRMDESAEVFRRIARTSASSTEAQGVVDQAKELLKVMTSPKPVVTGNQNTITTTTPGETSTFTQWTITEDNQLHSPTAPGYTSWTVGIELLPRNGDNTFRSHASPNLYGHKPLREHIADAILEINDLVIVPNTENGVMFAFDRSSGELRWRHDGWSSMSTPVQDDGRIYIAGFIGDVTVIDAATGATSSWMPPEFGHSTRIDEFEPMTASIIKTNPLTLGVQRANRIHRHIEFGPDRIHPPNREPDASPPSAVVTKDVRAQRIAAINALAAQGESRLAVTELLDIVRTGGADNEDYERVAALDALFTLCGDSLAANLADYLDVGASDFTRLVLDHLVRLRWTKDIAAIARLLRNNRGSDVPVAATRAVISLVPINEAAALIRQELPFCNERFHDEIMALLAGAGDKFALAEIKTGTEWRHASEYNQAFISLCLAGDADALQIVDRRILTWEHDNSFSQDETMRDWTPYGAIKLVRDRIPLARFVPVLSELVHREFSTWPEAETVQALERIGEPGGAPALIRMLHADSAFDHQKVAIVKALESISGQSFGTDTARWDAWWFSTNPP